MIKKYSNIEQLAERFDVFLLDMWGVLHDGERPYEGAVETLSRLSGAGKSIILLSNAPKRAGKAEEKLSEMGFKRELYDKVLTSGEIVHNFLLEKEGGFGKYYYYMGPQRDKDLLYSLPSYEPVKKPEDADFAVVTGYDREDSPRDEKMEELKKCRDKEIPLICANPDLVIVKHDGSRPLCAGVIAKQYEDMGGEVLSFGKPHAPIYERSMEFAGMEDRNVIVAIGDNLHTDIAGANKRGIYSVLVTGGILAEELGVEDGSLPDEEKLIETCNDHGGIFPKAIMPSFNW